MGKGCATFAACRLLSALAWIGERAQWVLAIGVVAALALPGPGAVLSGTLPLWVAVLFALAMARVDLPTVARLALAPRRLARNLGLCALLMGVTPVVFWSIGVAAGLHQSHIEAVVYTSAGPPLGSGAALCLMLGLNAAFALEITVLGSFLAPFTMPVISRLLLGEAVPIDVLAMTVRLAAMIGGATIGALALRRYLGAAWIGERARALDGLSAVGLVLFLFPLFHGMPELIAAMPAFAAATLALAIGVNLGAQLLVFPVCKLVTDRDTAGATALIWGNRNAALALASLPPDPLLTLYVALYQFPMYFTPLVMRPFLAPARR